MAGKAPNVPRRTEPDTRFDEFSTARVDPSLQSLNRTTENKAPNNRYLKLRGGVMEGLQGAVWNSSTLNSGVLELWKDSNGNDVLPRAHVFVTSESGSEDTLDTIDLNGMEVEGGRLTLFGIVGTDIIISHNATPSGSTDVAIFCPGDDNYYLDGGDTVDLIYDKSSDYWRIVNSTVYSDMEVRTTENTVPEMRVFRDDSSPNDNNVVGEYIFTGRNSADEKIDYCDIQGVAEDVTDSTEDGTMRLRVRDGGSLNTAIEIDGSAQEITIDNTYDLVFSTSTGSKIGTASGQKIGFWGVTPVIQRSAYTVTNHITDRSYDANATSVAELADVLGTLLVDLRSIGIVQ